MITLDSSPQSGVLPTPLTSLVGRQREVGAIVTLFQRDDVPLITLTGPGGVGKTRIALGAIEAGRSLFPGGVVTVTLASVADSRHVAQSIGEALGVREGEQALVSRIADHIRSRTMLLFLDNFEHVVSAAPIVSTLLQACPNLTVLATSRESLKLGGEHEFTVNPLSLPRPAVPTSPAEALEFEAVRLFVERATAVDPSFELTQANVSTVIDICRRVDGLPLAIELAAARIKTLPPEALLARLRERLRLLGGTRRDLPERQQTMRNTISWSYDLLSTKERRVMRSLSVFVGGFSLEAGEFIGSDPADPESGCFEELSSLVDKSLIGLEVRPDGEPRYLMLETLREFALERLEESGEDGLAKLRHAEWARDLAIGHDTGNHHIRTPEQITATTLEHDNLRAALQYFESNGDGDSLLAMANALAPFWWTCSHYAEGLGWMERALELGDPTDIAAYAPVMAAAGTHMYLLGDGQRGVEVVRKCLAMFGPESDPSDQIYVRYLLAMITIGLGEYHEAIPQIDAALALFDEQSDPGWFGMLYHLRGVVEFGLGDLEGARGWLDTSLAFQREHGDVWGISLALDYIGLVAGMSGDRQTAAAALRESVAIWQAFGASVLVSDWLMLVATLALLEEPPENVARLIGAAEMVLLSRGSIWELPERTCYLQTSATVRADLGEQGWAEQNALGRALTPDQACSEAIDVLDRLLGAKAAPQPQSMPVPGLTPREIDILRLLATGRTDKEIADELFISLRTAQTHVSNILGKLGVSNRSEAALIAVRNNI